MNQKIELGDVVECIHTGFKGTALAKTEFMNGCVQYTIIPKCKKDGKMPEELALDEQSLKVISKKRKKIEKKETGGPIRKAIGMKGF